MRRVKFSVGVESFCLSWTRKHVSTTRKGGCQRVRSPWRTSTASEGEGLFKEARVISPIKRERFSEGVAAPFSEKKAYFRGQKEIAHGKPFAPV